MSNRSNHRMTAHDRAVESQIQTRAMLTAPTPPSGTDTMQAGRHSQKYTDLQKAIAALPANQQVVFHLFLDYLKGDTHG